MSKAEKHTFSIKLAETSKIIDHVGIWGGLSLAAIGLLGIPWLMAPLGTVAAGNAIAASGISALSLFLKNIAIGRLKNKIG